MLRIIPTYNEAENIEELIKLFTKLFQRKGLKLLLWIIPGTTNIANFLWKNSGLLEKIKN
ncbi:MAG: hypothetical protein QXQ18_00440 [Candidatus Aenigmatarchaeota archaeon]